MRSVQAIMGDVVAATSAAVMPAVIYNLEQVTGFDQSITDINYQYCHEKEMSSTLARWANDSTKQYKNMPLIWVREDLKFGQNGDFRTVIFPSIIIAYNTQSKYTSDERELQTFSPALRPIYFELLRQIYVSQEFRVYGQRNDMPHEYIERKFWGTPEDTKAQSVFTMPVDAIEIVNLTLTLEEECDTMII